MTRSTDLLGKVRALLRPDFAKVKAESYNEAYSFIFDDSLVAGDNSDQPVRQCVLKDSEQVMVKAGATSDPKQIPGITAWDAKFEGVWDIGQANFISEKVTRIFGGKRKDD